MKNKQLGIELFKRSVLIVITSFCLTLLFTSSSLSQKIKISHAKNISIFKLEDARPLRAQVNIAIPTKSTVGMEAWKDIVTPGIDWLEQNQSADGSWGQSGKTDIRDTEQVLETIHWLNYQEHASFSNGIDWFRLSFAGNNDYTARKVYILSFISDDTTGLNDFFAQQINPNGGFGYQAGYASDILTSALVLRALTASGYKDPGDNPDATVIAILNYLLTSTNADGAWGYRRGDESALYPTLIVLEALLPYKSFTLGRPGGDIIIATKIELALSWVLNKQQADGGFGSGSSNITLSALTYHILLQYEAYPVDNERAISYLLNSQEADGSWNAQDPYATASALMALGRPDLEVTNIEQVSELLEPNQPATFRITLSNNLGYIDSQPFNFLKEPQQVKVFIDREQETVTCEGPGCEEYEVIYLEAGQVWSFDLGVRNLPAGKHTICLEIDYPHSEFRKENNIKSLDFTWTGGFIGPRPPSWIGAATSPTPDLIELRWFESIDPVAEYHIYFGKASGQYDYLAQAYPGQGIGVYLGDYLFDHQIDYFQPGIEYFIAIIAYDNLDNRGDISMETSAFVYSNPDSVIGDIPIYINDNNGKFVPNANINVFGIGDVSNLDYDPVYLGYYPGNYYLTVSKAGYEQDAGVIEILPSQTAEPVSFVLKIIDDGTPPPVITGVAVQPGNGQVEVSWDQLGDSVSDFYYYAVYRKTSSFTNIAGMTPIGKLSNPHTGTYTDSSVVNGISYYYAITAVDLAGNELPEVISAGPAKPNSPPVFSNLRAQQRSDGMVQINYDVTDQENPTLTLSLEYDVGVGWQAVTHSSGMGTQAIGTGKFALWEAKQETDGLDQDIKIRLTASDGEAVHSTTQIESAPFHLDTLNPPLPLVDAVESPTSIRSQTLTGTKETGTALRLNGKEIKALGTGADWDHEVSLSEGTNSFSFVAKDAFSNMSGTQGITIVLDTLSPDESTSVVEVEKISPTELKLSWEAVTKDSIGNPETVQKYLIYRGTTANFEPTPENLIAEATETTYTDTPATLGNVDFNSYYAIEAVDAAGNRSWLANRIGEYDFRLHTTIGTDYTLISLPFSIEGVELASDLASYIKDHTDKQTSVISICYWNAEAQSYSGYYAIPEPFGDFPLSAGSAYQIEVWINGIDEVNDNTTVTFVGKVPGPRTFDLKTTTGANFTWVSLPVGHPDIVKASQLKDYIEKHTNPPTTVRTISYWNPVGQSYRTYDPVPDPSFGDFEVKDGQAYQVEVTEDTIWSP